MPCSPGAPQPPDSRTSRALGELGVLGVLGAAGPHDLLPFSPRLPPRPGAPSTLATGPRPACTSHWEGAELRPPWWSVLSTAKSRPARAYKMLNQTRRETVPPSVAVAVRGVSKVAGFNRAETPPSTRMPPPCRKELLSPTSCAGTHSPCQQDPNVQTVTFKRAEAWAAIVSAPLCREVRQP